MDPADLLRRLAVGLQAGELPQDVARWLRSGLDAYLAGEARSLDAALQIQCRQGRASEHPATFLRLEDRDRLIRSMAYWLDLPTPGETAQTIADLISGARVMDDHLPIRVLLKRLRQHDRLPTSAKQIGRIIGGCRSL